MVVDDEVGVVVRVCCVDRDGVVVAGGNYAAGALEE